MKPPAGGRGGGRGKDKAGAVDPSLPQFKCQECHRALVIAGVESFGDSLPTQAASGMQASAVQGSIMGASMMDDSYVVLPKQNRSQGPGILPHPAASIYKPSASEGGGPQLPQESVNSSNASPRTNSGFHSRVTVLKRAFEIANSQTQVEQPLCLECMRILSDKMDKEMEDVSTDIKAYEAALQHLEQESYNILCETNFHKEKQKVWSCEFVLEHKI